MRNAAIKLVAKEMISKSFKRKFFTFSLFLLDFDFLAELVKPNEFETCFACDVHFVCATKKILCHTQKQIVVYFSWRIQNVYD